MCKCATNTRGVQMISKSTQVNAAFGTIKRLASTVLINTFNCYTFNTCTDCELHAAKIQGSIWDVQDQHLSLPIAAHGCVCVHTRLRVPSHHTQEVKANLRGHV